MGIEKNGPSQGPFKRKEQELLVQTVENNFFKIWSYLGKNALKNGLETLVMSTIFAQAGPSIRLWPSDMKNIFFSLFRTTFKKSLSLDLVTSGFLINPSHIQMKDPLS